MARSTQSQPPHGSDLATLGRVLLVTGPEEYLNEQVVTEASAAVAAADPESEHSQTLAGELTMATLGELSAPSLFSSVRCVVVRSLEDLDDSVHDGLLQYTADPDPDVALVLLHSGGQRGSGLLTKLRKLPTVQERKSEAVKGRGHVDFVVGEGRRRQVRIDSETASYLVTAVGTDLRALAAAVHQLADDFPGEQLDLELVRPYFSGRAEVKGFAIADAAMAGQTARALAELRWALQTGTEAPAITGAFAFKVRQLARLKGAAPGLRDADLAREVGAAPFMIRTLRGQARGWDAAALGTAVRAVAQADAAVKGNAVAADYELERMIFTICRAAASA